MDGSTKPHLISLYIGNRYEATTLTCPQCGKQGVKLDKLSDNELLKCLYCEYEFTQKG